MREMKYERNLLSSSPISIISFVTDELIIFIYSYNILFANKYSKAH